MSEFLVRSIICTFFNSFGHAKTEKICLNFFFLRFHILKTRIKINYAFLIILREKRFIRQIIILESTEYAKYVVLPLYKELWK